MTRIFIKGPARTRRGPRKVKVETLPGPLTPAMIEKRKKIVENMLDMIDGFPTIEGDIRLHYGMVLMRYQEP